MCFARFTLCLAFFSDGREPSGSRFSECCALSFVGAPLFEPTLAIRAPRSAASKRRSASPASNCSGVFFVMAPADKRALTIFSHTLGYFHGTCGIFDIGTDFAIYKALRVSPYQAHLITSGMMFGRKARLLSDLLKNEKTYENGQLLSAFNSARGVSKRDIITHGYHILSNEKITFIERSISNEFKVRKHEFTFKEFLEYCGDFGRKVQAFEELLGPHEEIDAFAKTCLNFSNSE